MVKKRHKLLLILASGILLVLSFPKVSLGFLAWGAWVPFFYVIRVSNSRKEALGWGSLTGLVFFGISLSWLNYVAGLGWAFVACLEALFFAFFGLCVYEAKRFTNCYLRVLWMSLSWTVAELVRAEVPVFGLGWNLLAYSQADYLWVIQFANLFGAYGLGFIMMAVNAGLAEMAGRQTLRTRVVLGVLIVLIFVFLGWYGKTELSQKGSPSAGELRIALIQGNIPQSLKWEPVAKDKILEIHQKLTQIAGFDDPHLVIWPEASFPGYFNRSYDAKAVQELIRKMEVPLLFGAPYYEDVRTAFNSAYFLGPDGNLKGRYDKLILVPFGEYVPWKLVFGWLEPLAYSLGVSDFSEGSELKVFDLQNGDITFSVLICFEDTFPRLARSFARQGIDFLVGLTNDAWFGPTGAPYQHFQASIFRAVENGIPYVRSANTGVSAFISRKGEVLDRVRREGKDIFVAGKKTFNLPLDKKPTFYGRNGWFFPYAASGFLVCMFLTVLSRRRKTDV